MRVSKLGLLAAAAIAAGLAGCSLPEVLPMAGGMSQGPSPYGAWYEQHWATNSVLLAAADQPMGEEPAATTASEEEAEIDKALAEYEAADHAAEQQGIAPEASAEPASPHQEFSNSTPYQFPAEQFQPQAPPPPAEELTAPPPPVEEQQPATVPGGPIRY